MTTHRAQCSCGQLSAVCTGEPVRVAVCHCFSCKQKTGSAFGLSVSFHEKDVQIDGRATEWLYVGNEGSHSLRRFCPVCGTTLCWSRGSGHVSVSGGCFADVAFPSAPTVSVYHDDRKYPWVEITSEPLERH